MVNNRYGNKFFYWVYSKIFGYDEVKFWKRRAIVVNPNDRTPLFLKMYYLIHLKRSEAKNSASMGTALHAGAEFASTPNLPHGITGIFISHSAKIGKNCTILQNVTIGSSKGAAPTIGDNCVIGASAVIVGGIKIGNNCNIGANVTVFKDVPDNTTVVCQAPRYLINKNNNPDRKF